MRDLPTRVSSTARVRSLDGGVNGRARSTSSSATASPIATATPLHVPPVKLVRFPVVRERTGLSRSTIWRLERRGEFPRHHRIAPNVVAWIEEEVSAWILERTTVPAAQSA